MRRSLARLAACVLVIATAASAKWSVLSVAGTPSDVSVADGGYFAISTSTGAFAMLTDGTSVLQESSAGAYVTAFIDSRGCLGAIQNSSTISVILYDSACPTSSQTVSSTGPIAFRQTSAGTAYFLGFNSSTTTSAYLYSPTGGVANDWTSLDTTQVSQQINARPAFPLATLHSGSTDIALFSLGFSTQRFGYAQGTGLISLFGGNGSTARSLALIDATDAIDVDADAGVTVLAGLPSPQFKPTNAAASTAVAYSPATDLDGTGFGLLAPLAGSTFQHPVPDLANPGLTWVDNSAPPPTFTGTISRLACFGAQLCVGITGNLNTNNVVVYENASPPAADIAPLLVLDAGVTVTMNVDAGDPDGEPIRLFWSTDAGSAVSVVPQSADGRAVQIVTGPNTMPCATPTANFGAEAIASDGLAAHRTPYPFTVQVPRIFSPASAAALAVDAGYQLATNSIDVAVDATGLNCPLDRSAQIAVTVSQGGTQVASNTIPAVSGAFPVPLQGCAGGSFTVTAQLTDVTGTGPLVTQNFSAPPVPAKVGAISTPTLVARCGQPVAAQLSTAPASGACAGESFSWHQVSGPALTTPTQTGAQFQLETVSASPKDLIGQSVTLAVDADAGNGTTDQATTTVTIGAEPFVSVTHDTPNSSDPDLPRTVSVSIDNPTGCDLPTTSLIEQLGGSQFVEGSAKLDGQPVTASLSGGALRIDGIPIEAGGHHVLQFDTRPSILGTQTPGGELTYRDVPVSQAAVNTGQVPAVGCGCQSASDVSWILILPGALLLLSTRKRKAT